MYTGTCAHLNSRSTDDYQLRSIPRNPNDAFARTINWSYRVRNYADTKPGQQSSHKQEWRVLHKYFWTENESATLSTEQWLKCTHQLLVWSTKSRSNTYFGKWNSKPTNDIGNWSNHQWLHLGISQNENISTTEPNNWQLNLICQSCSETA